MHGVCAMAVRARWRRDEPALRDCLAVCALHVRRDVLLRLVAARGFLRMSFVAGCAKENAVQTVLGGFAVPDRQDLVPPMA